VTPLYASYGAIALWGVSWVLASLWSRRTAARPPVLDQAAYLAPTLAGGLLIAVDARAAMEASALGFGDPALWRLNAAAGWGLFGLCLLGLAFTWWARLTLGDLWSSSVQRKDGHRLVERGPYRLVRHPIYSGLILALTAASLELARPAGMLGTALLVLGFWMKARLEERFLSAELGEGAYADYRRRTPMLAPFWPMRRGSPGSKGA
jgi:protein-S-isoprenylcysteine O-methyltransferase Ste14